MNKLAEQLSNDIAIRAAQKLAALNGGMQKTANLSSIVSDVAKGTAQGAINALIGTVAGNGLGAIAEDFVSPEDGTGAIPALSGMLGGYALPIARDLTSIGKHNIPYHIGDLLGTIGANQMLQNSALANYSINNPEQPEEDPKLASLREKTAAGTADLIYGGLGSGFKGALKGAITGGMGGLATSFIRDYGTDDFNPLKDSLIGGMIGTGVGGSLGALGGLANAAAMNHIIQQGGMA